MTIYSSYSQSELKHSLKDKLNSYKDIQICELALEIGTQIDEYLDYNFKVFEMAMKARLNYNGNLSDKQRNVLEQALINYHVAWSIEL